MSSEEHLIEDIAEASCVLKEFLGDCVPAVGVILGSGLNPFAENLRDTRILDFNDVPHMLVSTADGHKGRFVLGRVSADMLSDEDRTACLTPSHEADEQAIGEGSSTEVAHHETDAWVLCMQGRLHGYEGATATQVAFPVWLMHEVGIDTLITTNAAGAINPAFHVGDFCVMTDQMNLTGRNPLCGVQPNRMADRFVPMKDAFDIELRSLALRVASALDIRVQQGVYAGLLGPSFETPAEVRMLGILGADTVAMSVCEEVIAARHCQMRVLGMSLCSNMACGIDNADPSGGEVMDVAALRELDFSRLMTCIILAILVK